MDFVVCFLFFFSGFCGGKFDDSSNSALAVHMRTHHSGDIPLAAPVCFPVSPFPFSSFEHFSALFDFSSGSARHTVPLDHTNFSTLPTNQPSDLPTLLRLKSAALIPPPHLLTSLDPAFFLPSRKVFAFFFFFCLLLASLNGCKDLPPMLET
ncbi:hypothetical protein IWZ00DRAFT_86282 [Phyllosticta capitalensis]